jgi:hypothetical protein
MTEIPVELFERQHALATATQLSDAGITEDDVGRLVDLRRLAPMTRRVFRLLGAPETQAQRVLAAVLDADPNAVLSHASALAWWQVPGFGLKQVHVTTPRSAPRRSRRRAEVVWHKGRVPDRHVRVLDGVPVVSPTRALFDTAGMAEMHPQRIERAVDNAWSMRLVSGHTLRRMLREVTTKGRPGIAVMRDVLADRGLDYVPPASNLEGRVADILKGQGHSELRRQVDTGDDESWIARVDFADTELPFRLEVQSERFHASLLDTRTDRERKARLEAAGFVTVVVTDDEVWHYPDVVVEKVRVGRYEGKLRREAARAPGPAPEPVGASP